MCGIIGYMGWRNSRDVVIHGLKMMEYRGYDSAGIYDGTRVVKAVGDISTLEKKAGFLKGSGIGIGHTRWATHGGVSEENAHPHADCGGKIFAVHNGIIDNYAEIRRMLSGHVFRSQTDSEVIPHFFEPGITEERIREFMALAKGEFAIVMTDGKRIYAMKRGSPLVIGIGSGEYFIASDIYAFLDFTREAVFLDDGEYAIIDKGGIRLFSNGAEIKKRPVTLPDIDFKPSKDGEHFMISEIREGPSVLTRLLSSLEFDRNFRMFVDEISSSEMVVPVAAGTSYHAGYFFSLLLQRLGKVSYPVLASEASSHTLKGTIVAISQSGETMDVIQALKGREFIGVVNVPYSTIERMSKFSVNILAGKETAVASTKTFLNQIGLFTRAYQEISGESHDMVKPVRKAVSMENAAATWADELSNEKVIYVLGSGINLPIAMEIALKIKEIAYIPVLPMASGELKHGTLALIEKGTPVIIISDFEQDRVAAHEISARGGRIFEIASVPSGKAERVVVSGFNDVGHSMFSAVFGQMLSYHIAKKLGREIDKPRNLAKSVTVR